jgi:hypothetical protein
MAQQLEIYPIEAEIAMFDHAMDGRLPLPTAT